MSKRPLESYEQEFVKLLAKGMKIRLEQKSEGSKVIQEKGA